MSTIHPVCTCGTPLGHIYPYFREEKMKRLRKIRSKTIKSMKKELNTTADIEISDGDIDVSGLNMRDIIEKCHLDSRECCIIMLMGHRDNMPLGE